MIDILGHDTAASTGGFLDAALDADAAFAFLGAAGAAARRLGAAVAAAAAGCEPRGPVIGARSASDGDDAAGMLRRMDAPSAGVGSGEVMSNSKDVYIISVHNCLLAQHLRGPRRTPAQHDKC